MHTIARRIAILAALMPLLGGASVAPAQQGAETRTAERAGAPTLFSLDFSGGAVSDLVSAIRLAHPNATIVTSADAARYLVPPLTLRQVDLTSVGRLVERVASPPPGETRFLSVSAMPIAGADEVALSVSAIAHGAPEPARTRTWSVREHLNGGMAADDLLSAVQAMLETEPGATSVRFHEPTALLIIRGSGPQLSLVNDGLEQLRAEVRGDAGREEDIRNELRGLSDQMVHAEVDLRVANKTVEVTRMQVDEIRKSVETGVASRVALAEAELMVVRAEGDLQIAAQRTERLDAEIKRLRALLDD